MAERPLAKCIGVKRARKLLGGADGAQNAELLAEMERLLG